MSKFCVWVVKAPNPHWQGLYDLAQEITTALQTLGHDAVRVAHTYPLSGGRLVVLNAHVLPFVNQTLKLPDDAILFNAEQISALYKSKRLCFDPYFDLLRAHTIWDYSQVNIERRRVYGIERAVHCPIGRTNVAFRERPKDLDVLFFGSINDRREKLLAQIGMRGLSVKHLFGVYGAERDRWIERAKIVLNAHFYVNPIFEIIRCAPLYSAGCCVVSESGGCDPALESLAAAAGVHVPYDQIPGACAALAKDAARRADIGVRAKAAISKIDFVESVRNALEKTT